MHEKSTIDAACPSCGKQFKLDAELLGRKGRCDACDTKFIIEEAPKRKAKKKEAVSPPPQALASAKSSSGVGVGVAAIALVGVLGVGYFFYDTQAPSSGGTPVVTAGSLDVSKEPALAPLVESFPVVETFSEPDIRKYMQRYPDVHMGWMPSKVEQAEEAKGWGHYLGPLGVRIRSYVPQHQGRACFAAIVPDCLRGEDGRLALTAAEVVSIAPGSPAEGKLEEGDLIIGIEGEVLQSGNKYRPDWEFMHKDRREVQLMFGEKLDTAQARGDVRLSVMRYPRPSETVFSEEMVESDGKCMLSETAVRAGDEIHLIVDKKDKNDFDHFTWLTPALNGPAGSLDLSDEAKIKPMKATTGWGKVTRGKDLTGKVIAEPCLSVHGDSTLVFVVPEGFDRFTTGMQVTHGKADLRAEVRIIKQREALPVVRRPLWEGVGGNQSVGAQEFSVEVSGDGFLTLESDQFDGNIHGDGTMWCDVVLEGDYGTINLLGVPYESASPGYGRVRVELEKPHEFQGKQYAQSMYLHAHGEATWKLPEGTKRAKGVFMASSYGKVQPRVSYTNLALPLEGIHKQKVVDLRIPIGKVESFSETYPKDCAKSELTARRQVAWLAGQQRENGTWPRLRGYTTDGWDTSWCGLALMSSGDSQYDEQVKKAAYQMAYHSVPSEWTAERAMRLIFLSEYYLRTKDVGILAGVQAAYHQMIDVCKNDYMAGHKVNGFGYGIAGQHYGTGHLALGVALASRTPITVDKQLVDSIIRHAGEVCVNGTYAYGRGRRMKRDESRRHGGGHAMSGPGVLGMQIAGGHRESIKEAVERWEASIGDGDNSHATSSLAFIFSSLAMAVADEAVFLKHMQNFKYKMTIDDNWEGGYLKSAFPLDFQGGEGVTSMWIRTAGSILTLNALKHNLAITGKKELMASERIEGSVVSEWGGQVHSYYLRNWCIANELLGEKAPLALAEGIAKMQGFERDLKLVPNTNDLVQKLAPDLVREIAGDSSLDAMQRAYAIELITGLNFQLSTQVEGEKQAVQLNVFLPLQQLNWLEEDKEAFYKQSPLPLKATVAVEGSNLASAIQMKVDGLEGFNFDQGTRKLKASAALKDSGVKEFSGVAKIAFFLGGQHISYQRPLEFNKLLVTKNEANFRRFDLKLKTGPRAYFQSQPLVISGIAFDCMYPIETLPPVTAPDGALIDVHEGDVVTVNMASENMICGTVYTLSYDAKTQVKHEVPASVKAVRGAIDGDLAAWTDHSGETVATVKMDEGKAVLEYDFGKAVTLNGLDVKDSRAYMRVWYHDGQQWIPLVWDSYSSYSNQNPVFPDTQAQKWRIEFFGRDLKLKTLRFYYNRHQLTKRLPLIQSVDTKFLPPIQPE
ncbi:DUF6288 domain-containing protein [Rubritalea tangerina]|uniref:DUF6288 domain-containing protein n=1 Tax=Rubritalea tangerina TaxID=430798 RepID=A0ABW4ZGC1_9BACT